MGALVPFAVTEAPQEDLERVIASGAGGILEDVGLALDAWRLRLTDQFDELLCLARLKDVRRLDYQVETVHRVLRTFRGRALLADEVGLGKTIEAGMLISEYLLRGMARTVLVVCPAALVGQWCQELAEKFSVEAHSTEEPHFRTTPEAAWSGGSEPRVVVASLQMIRTARHAELVRAQRWDLLVIDEAHHVKNRTTAGFKLLDSLKSRFLLLLTATPVENDLEELYNLVTLLKPGQLATPAAFKRQFVEKGDPFSPRNRERLRELLGEVMVRNTRALAGRGIELPPRFAQTVVVEPSPEEQALYKAVVDLVRSVKNSRLALRTLLEEAGSSAEAVLDTLARLDSGLGAAPLARVAEVARSATQIQARKLAKLLEIIRALGSFSPDSKAVVFTRFRATLDALSAALDAADVPHSSFTGGMSGPAKNRAVEQLRDEVPVMLATDVGGEGRNLQFANVLVNYDLPWNPMKIEQRIGRLHRIGQTREVRVFSLCARGSAEERILDVLDRRIHLFELVIGEVDLILGRALEEKEFDERIFEIYEHSKTEEEVMARFEGLADELAAARGHYEKVRELDEALFR
ncbi:MAG TPA: SNF2-related protein, partial [Anaeromyxobacteraceae bacterium]|nr:SNF2-related protein [Anaeromyxobacteraceae bacterium]